MALFYPASSLCFNGVTGSNPHRPMQRCTGSTPVTAAAFSRGGVVEAIAAAEPCCFPLAWPLRRKRWEGNASVFSLSFGAWMNSAVDSFQKLRSFEIAWLGAWDHGGFRSLGLSISSPTEKAVCVSGIGRIEGFAPKAFSGENGLPDANESPLIVCFGEMLIDFVPTISGLSLAEAPAFKKAPGGAPANVAVGIARLGGSSAFIGKVSSRFQGYYRLE
ncbi:hypothetical protein ACLOJK_007274 [Asimina triloba]